MPLACVHSGRFLAGIVGVEIGYHARLHVHQFRLRPGISVDRAIAIGLESIKQQERSGAKTYLGLAMGELGRAYIVNEAHGLRKDVIRQLLVVLERIPPHSLWIFTTTIEGQEAIFEDYDDASPLLSRCLRPRGEARP